MQSSSAKRNKDNPIHTVVDDPIRIDNLSEASGLEFVRDVMATWYYLMMEVYGKSSREKVLRGNETANIAWEEYLRERVGVVDFYDTEIELNADYRPKSIVRPEQVWNAVAKIKNPTIENILDVEYAKQLILDAENNDFQRRF